MRAESSGWDSCLYKKRKKSERFLSRECTVRRWSSARQEDTSYQERNLPTLILDFHPAELWEMAVGEAT